MGLRIHYECYLEVIRNKEITDDNRVNLFIFFYIFSASSIFGGQLDIQGTYTKTSVDVVY